MKGGAGVIEQQVTGERKAFEVKRNEEWEIKGSWFPYLFFEQLT